MQNNVVLRMTDICKYYPGVTALDHVSFDLCAGEVHALLGENGAGKSTLVKIIAGAIARDGGSFEIGEEPITSLTPAEAKEKGISIIYQEFNLVPYLKVYENLFLGKELKNGLNIQKKAMIEKTREVMRRLQIDIDPEARVAELTNGYKQIVEISKAILEDARILIMDEPTAPLTAGEVRVLFDLIKDLKKNGIGIIYISHRLEELFEVSDRITIMRDGQYIKTLETCGTNRGELIRLMVGRELGEDFPSRESVIGEEILRVEHLSTKETKLHDISFKLYRGEILGFAGLVGAGRTEVMRAVFGADPRTEGAIYVKGKPVEIRCPMDAISSGISLVPEDRKGQGVSLTMSIRENVSLVVLKHIKNLASINLRKDKELCRQYIDLLAIKTPSMEQKVNNLSGGNQQKVAIAKWMVTNADIIILDEPTRGIDVGAKQEIYHLMNQLIASGKSLIMISSEMPELLGMSDRIIVMHEGRISGEISHAEATQEMILELASGGVENEVDA